ncbi:hypothetical protein ES703_95679 [subsurface metagenome]
MSQQQTKQKPKQEAKKEQPWNSFAYLGGLAKRKDPVVVYLNANTIEDQSELKGVIIDADNYTLAFLTNDHRELLVFKHAVRYIETVRKK